jgi:hypothetical protein
MLARAMLDLADRRGLPTALSASGGRPISFVARAVVAALVTVVACACQGGVGPVANSSSAATPATLEPTASAPAQSERPSPEPSPTPAPLADAVGTTFEGTTSQGQKVLLTIGPGPSLIFPTELWASWTCSDGSTSASSYGLGFGARQDLDGTSFRFFADLGEGWSGTFASDTAVAGGGHIVDTLNLLGGKTMTCDSGPFTWSAIAVSKSAPPPVVAGPVPPLDLQAAIAVGYVQVLVKGVGASSGDSIVLEIESRIEASLDIDLSQGTKLESTAAGFQNMVVRVLKGELSDPFAQSYSPTDAIHLDAFGVAFYVAEAYCLDFHGDNPQDATGFSVVGPASRDVRAVLAAADGMTPVPSVAAIQAAIWAMTDDVSSDELLARFAVSDAQLSEASALLRAAGIDPLTRRLFGG